MNSKRNRNLRGSRALVVVALFGLWTTGACSDTPTEPEEHVEPEGVQLIMTGEVIASYDGDDQSWEGELEVGDGEQTGRIDVVFVDHDGDPVETEEETYLEVDVADEAVATFDQSTAGGFSGQLRGVGTGQTSAVFKLMHGEVGSGHPDFVTTPVAIHVGS